jgi:transposase InsO family protein
VSLKTISKLKDAYKEKSQTEKDRQLKRWEFAPGTHVWTIDFVCLLQTSCYKLQLLTVSDHRSRFLFSTVVVIDTSTDMIIKHLEELFVKYGKPWFIKADNGPEFRLDCREKLANFAVSLFNSPPYYGQFNACHERIHRIARESISSLATHHNLTKLVRELDQFHEDYNYSLPLESRGMKTPAEMYFSDTDYIPDGREIVTPYVKDGEIRIKYTNRYGMPARMSFPDCSSSRTCAPSINPHQFAAANPEISVLVN